MVDFYADWCISCKEMERFTFTDAKVQSRLKDVVLLQVDVTAGTPDDSALLKRFKLFGPPASCFSIARDAKFSVSGSLDIRIQKVFSRYSMQS